MGEVSVNLGDGGCQARSGAYAAKRGICQIRIKGANTLGEGPEKLGEEPVKIGEVLVIVGESLPI